MGLQELVNLFGYGLCHQIPERTMQSGGLFFAVCARDSGLHIGFAAALLAAFAGFGWSRYRRRPLPGTLPSWPVLVGMACLILPMAVDGLSSYLGFRETTNLIRFVTGALAGIASGSLVAPLLAEAYWSADSKQQAYSGKLGLLAQLAVPLALAGLFWIIYPKLGQLAVLAAVAALMAMVASLNLVVLGVTVKQRNSAKTSALLPWLAAGLILTLVELAAFDLVRYLLLEKLLGPQGIWSLFF